MRRTAGEAYRTESYWLIVIPDTPASIRCSSSSHAGCCTRWVPVYRRRVAAWTMRRVCDQRHRGRLIGGWLIDTITGRITSSSGSAFWSWARSSRFSRKHRRTAVAFAAASLYGVAFGWSFTCMNTCTAHSMAPAPSRARWNDDSAHLGHLLAAAAIGGDLRRLRRLHPGLQLNTLLAVVGIVVATSPRCPPQDATAGDREPPGRDELPRIPDRILNPFLRGGRNGDVG